MVHGDARLDRLPAARELFAAPSPANNVAVLLPNDDVWASSKARGQENRPPTSLGGFDETGSNITIDESMPAFLGSEVIPQILDAGFNFDFIDADAIEAVGIPYSPIREAAQVFVNGRLAGYVWHPPFSVEIAPMLKPGKNDLRIVVGNTAINELAGTSLPTYRLLYDRYDVEFMPQDMRGLEPLPSGILGPVALISSGLN